MFRKHFLVLISAAVVFGVIGVRAVMRYRQKLHAQKVIEYKGVYYDRKLANTEASISSIKVPFVERDSITNAAFTPKMAEQLFASVDSFLLAFSSSSFDDYTAFRFQNTKEPWTLQINEKRLKQQLPMWQSVLGSVNAKTPSIAQFSLLLSQISGIREDANGPPAFCLPCVVGWEKGTFSLDLYATNTIEQGLDALMKIASLNSQNTGSSVKQTFLAFPERREYRTAVVSFVVNTSRPKGKHVISMQLIWLPNDQLWNAVGIGFSPSDGWIAFPF